MTHLNMYYLLCIFCSTFRLLCKVGVIHFHVSYVYYKSTNDLVEECYVCLVIILDMWPILVGCLTEAKLWLIAKTMSKRKANCSSWWGSTSKQSLIATIQITIHNIGMHSRTHMDGVYYGPLTDDISKQNDGNPIEFNPSTNFYTIISYK